MQVSNKGKEWSERKVGVERDFRVKILDSKQFLKVVCAFNRLDQQKGHWNGGQDSSESGNQKIVDFTI